MNGQTKKHPVLDRIIQIALVIGFYDLIELIFEDILLWLMIRSRKKKRKALRKARINELLIRMG